MQIGKVGVHQFVRKSHIATPSRFGKFDAGFDEHGSRGEHPELLRPAAIVGHERFCCSMKLGARGTVVEHAPGRTTGIERVEDDVPLALKEGLYESTRKVENDRALSPLSDLRNELG